MESTTTTNDIEIRLIENEGLEVRAGTADKPAMLVGYAARFNSPSADLGGFKEVILPGAFKTSISGTGDIRALVSHDADKLLGRTSNNTLRVSEDANGLRVEIDVPDTSYGRDLMALVKRGDLKQMSFGFTVPDGGQSFTKDSNGQTIRKLSAVNLREVSAVATPAYAATSLQVRVAPSAIAAASASSFAKRDLAARKMKIANSSV